MASNLPARLFSSARHVGDNAARDTGASLADLDAGQQRYVRRPFDPSMQHLNGNFLPVTALANLPPSEGTRSCSRLSPL